MSARGAAGSGNAQAACMLTPKQQRFVDEYLVDLNATQAAIRAGYSARSAKQHGHSMLQRMDIQNAISSAMAARQARVQLTADEVIADLRMVRDVCMARKAVKVVEVVKYAGDVRQHEVESLVFDASGANKALALLGKHIGMFRERGDVTSNAQTASSGVLVVPELAKDEAQWISEHAAKQD